MLSQVKEEAKEMRESRLKSVKLADSFGFINRSKQLLEQGRRGVLLAKDIFDEEILEADSNFSMY